MKSNEITISDYLTAAALHAAGCTYLGAHLEGDRVTFRFDDENGSATKAVQSHGSGLLKVSSYQMAASINFLKSDMFGTRRAGGLR